MLIRKNNKVMRYNNKNQLRFSAVRQVCKNCGCECEICDCGHYKGCLKCRCSPFSIKHRCGFEFMDSYGTTHTCTFVKWGIGATSMHDHIAVHNINRMVYRERGKQAKLK